VASGRLKGGDERPKTALGVRPLRYAVTVTLVPAQRPYSRCDLHVHSRFSTDSGNYALRRARLGESLTEPERVYRVAKRRGMTLVTISDHNTLEGALRIAHLPDTFLSVEVTTRFPEDDVPLHVLVWNLTEEDHRDLQQYRTSVYELTAFLRGRGLVHALAHPLYRMGAPLTDSHIERMMLLFGLWEGRNGARPREANELACRLAAAASPERLVRLADKHGIEPVHDGSIGLTGGSDDHGALDIATTWTEARGATVADWLRSVQAGDSMPHGAHGSTVKLAHAAGGLFLRAWRERRGGLPTQALECLAALFDQDAEEPTQQHDEIATAAGRAARELVVDGLAGGADGGGIGALGGRIGLIALSAGLEVPYLVSSHHRAGSRAGLREIEDAFFGVAQATGSPRALVFTDTLEETNGVARTMKMLAEAAAAGTLPLSVVASGLKEERAGVLTLDPQLDFPLPGYEALPLRFPSPAAVLSLVEREAPDVIHVATPGPVGACGLGAAKLLGIPAVGSWHTELAPYALHITRDLLVAEALERYVDAFYRQCDSVLAPTRAIGAALTQRNLADRVGIWGRGVDTRLFSPSRRSDELRRRLLGDGDHLLLSVGRVSHEKRLDVLLEAFRRLTRDFPGIRLAVVGDGPSRSELEAAAPAGAVFLGELHGGELATVYASADIFCFASTTDTFGQVLLEAAASGLASVAADAGGAPELVRNGATGLLVTPSDAEALAAAIAGLVADAPLRQQLGAGAREAALAWTWERSFDQLLDAYASLAGSWQGSAVRAAA
jgi:glycosyltransferase involved in cell wall biosynthesis/predicted metal-dependent phosphoesterase TrpH